MQDHEMRGLLGPAYDDTTPAQRAAIAAASDKIATRWPDPDDADDRESAMSGALLVILGDDTDEALSRAALRARLAYLDAQARLTGAIIAGAITDPAEGDQPRAARLGIARDTVRKALGR